MTEQEIYRGLQRVFDDVFKRHDIRLTPQLSSKDVPGWDSFKQVNLLMGAEEFFQITFDSADVDELTNVGDLVRAVARRTA
jgi:acyl carrier protein